MNGKSPTPSPIHRDAGDRPFADDRWPDDPSADQTENQIRDYYTAANKNDLAVIRQTYTNQLFFIVSMVTGKKGNSLVHLADQPLTGLGGCSFWIKTGKNLSAPKGQARLVIPTPDVLAYAKRKPAKDLRLRNFGRFRREVT